MSWLCGTAGPSVLFPEINETSVQAQQNEKQEISQCVRRRNYENARNLGKSSAVKRKKLRSKVWEDFEKYKDENGKVWARCKVCEKLFDGSSKLGTSHLRNHSRSCQRKSNRVLDGDEPAELVDDSSGLTELAPVESVVDGQLNHSNEMRRIIMQGDVSLIDSENIGYVSQFYKDEKEKLRNYFHKLSCRFCLTIQEMSTCLNNLCCLRLWFIDDDWELKNKIVGFRTFRCDNFMEQVKNILLEWGIENKLSNMVVDTNDFLIHHTVLAKNREDWFANQSSVLFSKSLCNLTFFSQGHYCVYKFLNEIAFDLLHDSLHNFLQSIKEISSESGKFRNVLDIAVRLLGREVNTYQLIYGDWVEKLQSGEEIIYMGQLRSLLDLHGTFSELKRSHPHFISLSGRDWDMVRIICECYEDLDFLRNCNHQHTANYHFPLSTRLWKCFKELRIWNRASLSLSKSSYLYLYSTSRENDWYECNLVLAVATVLDPRFRMHFVKNWYKKIYDDDEWEIEFTYFKTYFTMVFNEYALDINVSRPQQNSSSILYKMLHQEPKHVQTSSSELHLYLEDVKFPLLDDFDILEWWRVNAWYFPTLAKMARDLLSIQISCHPNSSSFGKIVDILPQFHASSLDVNEAFEAYACTKSWLCKEI